MAKVIIENQRKTSIKPNLKDTQMFIGWDGVLYYGHYLKTNCRIAKPIL